MVFFALVFEFHIAELNFRRLELISLSRIGVHDGGPLLHGRLQVVLSLLHRRVVQDVATLDQRQLQIVGSLLLLVNRLEIIRKICLPACRIFET